MNRLRAPAKAVAATGTAVVEAVAAVAAASAAATAKLPHSLTTGLTHPGQPRFLI